MSDEQKKDIQHDTAEDSGGLKEADASTDASVSANAAGESAPASSPEHGEPSQDVQASPGGSTHKVEEEPELKPAAQDGGGAAETAAKASTAERGESKQNEASEAVPKASVADRAEKRRAAAETAAQASLEQGESKPEAAAEDKEAKAKAAAEARAARASARAKKPEAEENAGPKEPSPNQPRLDRIVQLLKQELGDDALEEAYINERDGHLPSLILKSSSWSSAAPWLRDHEELKLNYLRNVTGIDQETHMEVVYHLLSLDTQLEYAVKVKTNRDTPSIPSVTPVWPTANWNEREIYDLLGIHFPGHPDLRRIMMSDDWVGHPLRKDYEPLDPEV